MTTITIEGIGGGINFEMLLVQKALENAGFTVHVNNDSADWSVSSQDGWYEQMAAKVDSKTDHIKLVAKHIPWGG